MVEITVDASSLSSLFSSLILARDSESLSFMLGSIINRFDAVVSSSADVSSVVSSTSSVVSQVSPSSKVITSSSSVVTSSVSVPRDHTEVYCDCLRYVSSHTPTGNNFQLFHFEAIPCKIGGFCYFVLV